MEFFLLILQLIFYFIFIYYNLKNNSIKFPLLFVTYLNTIIFTKISCSQYFMGIETLSIFLYMFLILEFKNINYKNIIKRALMLYIVFILLALLSKLFLYENINQVFHKLLFIYFIILISYIEIYNLKFNNLKQTLKNLTINFYGFLVTTTILFGFKIYLSVQNITTPDLYYLFLTIPVSLLIIYFYTKDLTPVIKDLKK